ncbi:MAG TPA: hypothetical protein VF493_15865 [Terriglobales bacterium]
MTGVPWERSVDVERIDVPARPIRAFCNDTSSDLRASIGKIETWMGRPLPASSRFHLALAELDRLAQKGDFDVDPATRERGMRAIQLALDMFAIAEALPAERIADLRRDLEACAAGTLVPSGADFVPLQAQSQLIVRAALYRAGVAPSQPTHSGSGGRKKPDILIENGLSEYAIEVKRPTVLKNALPRAKDAAEQLDGAEMKGGIVIDVTDSVGNAEEADAAVVAQADRISAEFFTHGEGWKPGCRHVMMVGVIARPAWHYVPSGQKEGQVMIHSTSCVAAFGTKRGTLDTLHSHWMREKLNLGLNKLGFTSSEATA